MGKNFLWIFHTVLWNSIQFSTSTACKLNENYANSKSTHTHTRGAVRTKPNCRLNQQGHSAEQRQSGRQYFLTISHPSRVKDAEMQKSQQFSQAIKYCSAI